MQHIDADICFVLDGVRLRLFAKARGMVHAADTIAGRRIDVASTCKDLDALLSRDSHAATPMRHSSS